MPSSWGVFVSIPSTPPLVLTAFHHPPPCLFPAKLSLSSPPLLPLLSASLPLCLFFPPYPTPPHACLPSSFHLASLKLTVPEGRGHLRTKWRISRQLCAHSLRWPSIIHSLLPPPFSLSIFILPFSSLPAVAAFTSLLLLHTVIACLPLSLLFPPLSPSPPPPVFSYPLLLMSLLDAFNTLALSTVFSPHLYPPLDQPSRSLPPLH